MRVGSIHRVRGCLLAVLLLIGVEAPATAAGNDGPGQPTAPSRDAAPAEFQKKLEAYTQARQIYENEAGAYWTRIAEKRRLRNSKRRNHEPVVIDDYVLIQPPIYSGPPKPVDPSAVAPE